MKSARLTTQLDGAGKAPRQLVVLPWSLQQLAAEVPHLSAAESEEEAPYATQITCK